MYNSSIRLEALSIIDGAGAAEDEEEEEEEAAVVAVAVAVAEEDILLPEDSAATGPPLPLIQEGRRAACSLDRGAPPLPPLARA